MLTALVRKAESVLHPQSDASTIKGRFLPGLLECTLSSRCTVLAHTVCQELYLALIISLTSAVRAHMVWQEPYMAEHGSCISQGPSLVQECCAVLGSALEGQWIKGIAPL